MRNSHKPVFTGMLPDQAPGLRERIAAFVFRKAEFDEASLNYIKEYSEKGSVVFASFQSSNISLFMFYMVLRRHGIKTPAFVLDYNPILLQPIKFLWRRLGKSLSATFLRRKHPYVLDTNHIANLLEKKESVLFPLLSGKFFLRRYLEIKYDSLRYFIELQKKMDTPIYFFPQMIFWNQNPERTSPNLFQSSATSNKGFFSVLLSTSTPSFIRVLQPVNLQEEIKKSEGLSTGEIALRLRNRLIETYQQEKRIVLGPVLRSQQEMIEKVLFHNDVLNAIEQIAKEEGVPESQLKRKAYSYYREIAADYSFYVIRVFEVIMDWVFKRVFTGITWDPEELKMVREAAQRGTLVLTPCHKSHMDYLILPYIFFKNRINPPHVAAGANLSFFPLGTIFRHSGAFFLRRSFRGLNLYKVVFKQYIKTLVQESYPIEFFIEGGRTRTGRLVYPKPGILHYLIDAIDDNYNKDLVFVPISISYDRVLEEGSYAAELKGKSKQRESVAGVFKSSRVLWRKYGMAYVNFDKPFTLKDIEAQGFKGNDRVSEAANKIIRGINRATGVGPFSLSATAMILMSSKGFSRAGLLEKMKILHGFLSWSNVSFHAKAKEQENFDEILDLVLASYHADKLIEDIRFEDGQKLEDMYLLKEENRARIAFYKNSISHFLLGISFTSIGILFCRKNGPTMYVSEIVEHFDYLKKMLSREFIYPEEPKDSDSAVRLALSYYAMRGILTVDGDTVTLRDDTGGDLIFFARAVKDMIESYFIVLDLINQNYKKKLLSKDLVVDIRKNGLKLFHLGKVKLAESLSVPNYRSAIQKLKDEDILTEEVLSKKNSLFTAKDQVTPRKMRDTLEQYLALLS
jgi:glycerol-3-phosphate O-acyltransferase